MNALPKPSDQELLVLVDHINCPNGAKCESNNTQLFLNLQIDKMKIKNISFISTGRRLYYDTQKYFDLTTTEPGVFNEVMAFLLNRIQYKLDMIRAHDGVKVMESNEYPFMPSLGGTNTKTGENFLFDGSFVFRINKQLEYVQQLHFDDEITPYSIEVSSEKYKLYICIC